MATSMARDNASVLPIIPKRCFTCCIGAPRIAVLSLNPHAGDGGLLGMEEQEVIIPAMKEMEEKGILCYGPYAADGFMGSGNYTHFDGILAMYHDQGLAPFKALAMEDGVNYTAGLPVVRTSPAHGTAYDIAQYRMPFHEPEKYVLPAGLPYSSPRLP